ncbi:MAG: hypothetical protein LBJ00_18805 [Planctomycetaceae bacterium]|nr:hypothetical protein [Planctomycetaceae bacterium]
MNNRFTLLRLPSTLRYRFAATSGILKQLEYIRDTRDKRDTRDSVKHYSKRGDHGQIFGGVE